jgi:hypothetical protein
VRLRTFLLTPYVRARTVFLNSHPLTRTHMQPATPLPRLYAEPGYGSELDAIASRAKRHADDLNRWHVAAGCRTRLVGTGDVLDAAFAEIDALLAAQAQKAAA